MVAFGNIRVRSFPKIFDGWQDPVAFQWTSCTFYRIWKEIHTLGSIFIKWFTFVIPFATHSFKCTGRFPILVCKLYQSGCLLNWSLNFISCLKLTSCQISKSSLRNLSEHLNFAYVSLISRLSPKKEPILILPISRSKKILHFPSFVLSK